MSLVTTTNWIVTNLNLVFLNCVLLGVYKLKIADAIRADAQGSTIKPWSGELYPGKFWNLEPLKRDFLHSEPSFTTNYAKRSAIHIWY